MSTHALKFFKILIQHNYFLYLFEILENWYLFDAYKLSTLWCTISNHRKMSKNTRISFRLLSKRGSSQTIFTNKDLVQSERRSSWSCRSFICKKVGQSVLLCKRKVVIYAEQGENDCRVTMAADGEQI